MLSAILPRADEYVQMANGRSFCEDTGMDRHCYYSTSCCSERGARGGRVLSQGGTTIPIF